jgi:anti-anti-sigma factor
MDLRLTVRYRADTTIIACVGRLAYGEEAASLRARVKGLIAQGAQSIVLDLAGVTYVDSGALGVLTGLHMSARQSNYQFRLTNLTPRTAKLLQTTNLTNFFDIEASTAVPRSA